MRQIKELHDTFEGLNWETIFGSYVMTGDNFYLEFADFMDDICESINDGCILMPGQSL